MSRIRLVLLIGYVVLIFALSTRANLTPPGPEFHFKDKLAHIVEYGVLGVLLFRAFGSCTVSSRAVSFMLLLALGASVAAADEMVQGMVPGRYKDVYDWVADITGLAIGMSVLMFGAAGARKVDRDARDGGGSS